MDRRLRELQRRALAGDETAAEQVSYMECRMGIHVLNTGQIIMAEDFKHSHEDAGCCQCGNEMYDSRTLCERGHHHWYYNPWQADLAYWCARPGLDLMSQRKLQRRMNDAYFGGDIDLGNELRDELESYQNNPITHMGCRARLERNDACSQGMHFLHITPEGRVCRNPDCDYREADACSHPNSTRYEFDADGREVTSCARCQQRFRDHDICAVFGHRADSLTGNPCVRKNCAEHKAGTDIFSAIAETYRRTGRLRAVCREIRSSEYRLQIITTADARGWCQRLKDEFGIRKPRRKDAEHLDIKVGRWGRMLYQITVKVPWYRGSIMDSRSPLRHGVDYRECRAELKTRWSGNWYPLADNEIAAEAS